VSGQLGLEATPEEHILRLVEVFAEVHRVLRSDGTLWLNYGDCYATGAGKVGEHPGGGEQGERWKGYRGTRDGAPKHAAGAMGPMTQPNRMPQKGLKPKDLCMMPHRVALALQAWGWWVRSDIVWHKPAPMPESVTDRPTRSHEYVFLLTKAERYYYDAQAIAEPSVAGHGIGNGYKRPSLLSYADKNGARGNDTPWQPGGTRNRRTVWTIPTRAYSGAHFAVMPVALVEPCLLAGTSAHGACRACGAPFTRVVEKTSEQRQSEWNGNDRKNGCLAGGGHKGRTGQWFGEVTTTGWKQGCECWPCDPAPCVVLDIFSGSGTVGEVALQHGRDAILIELKPEYCTLIRKRLSRVQPKLLGT